MWQRFNQMIETEPETPTVMVEGYGKNDRNHKENGKDRLIVAAEKRNA
jgi:hypothetical protein